METLKIIIDIFHRGYERALDFLEQCRRVLEELGPLLGEVVILALPFSFFLWITYEVAEYFRPGTGIIVAILVAVPTIVLFAKEIRKRKTTPSSSVTPSGSVWSLKKVLLVLVLDLLLIGIAASLRLFNSSSDKLSVQQQSKVLDSSNSNKVVRIKTEDTNREPASDQSQTKSIDNKNLRIPQNKSPEVRIEPVEINPLSSPEVLYREIDAAFPDARLDVIKKYLDKPKFINWELTVFNMTREEEGIFGLWLYEYNSSFEEDHSLPFVRCTVKSTEHKWIIDIHKGDGVILRGKIIGIVQKEQGTFNRPEIIVEITKIEPQKPQG